MGFYYTASYEGCDITVSEDGNDGAHFTVTKDDKIIANGYRDSLIEGIHESIVKVETYIESQRPTPPLVLEANDKLSLDKITAKAQRVFKVDESISYCNDYVIVTIRKYKEDDEETKPLLC